MRRSCRFYPFALLWPIVALLTIAASLWATPSWGARAFILDKVSLTADPSLPWPAGPAGLTGRFDAAVPIASLGGSPAIFCWDVLADPGVILFLKNHYPANAFLGQSYSDLRALAATKPALIGAIFRKLVSRSVTINGQSVSVLLLVPQSDATSGDVEIVHEIPANRWFGVNDGED